jgi:hypothetical protein
LVGEVNIMSIFDYLLQHKHQAAVNKIARQEFELARGTAHVKLLRDARGRCIEKMKLFQKKKISLEEESRKVTNRSQVQLKKTLHRHLVETRLCEVPGIGPITKQVLISRIFVSELSDLRRASNLPGIGETKQFAINKWVAKYEAKIPELLIGDFPGKIKIEGETNQQTKAIHEKIQETESQRISFEKQVVLIDDTLKGFNVVTVEDFIQARLNQGQSKPQIDFYIRGVFAEWETPPDWFNEIIKVE